MRVITVLLVTILINKSCSQVLSLSPTCFSSGETLTLQCDTTDLSLGIKFYHNGISQGGCLSNVPPICGSGITQSGTTTSLVISQFTDATNSGNWSCEYGSSSSPDIIITVNPCEVTTKGSTEGPETSTNFESASIIESSSTSIFVESNTGISPTDAYQLNTLSIFSVSSDAEIFLSSIATSDSQHTSASFKTEIFETINATNASYFMHTASSVPNSLLTTMSLISNLDSYKTDIRSSMIKTETVSLLTVTIESGYQSTFDSILTELYITTSEISSGFIFSALKSSFSVTSEVYPMITYTDTVSTGTTTSDQMLDIKDTTAITPITANVFSRNSLSKDISVLQTTFDSITSSGSTIHQFMSSLVTSTAMSYSITSISEEAGFNSSFILESPRLTNTVLTVDAYGSMMTSKLVYENTSAFGLASGIISTNRQSSSETPLDSYYSVNTFRSFSTTHEEIFMNTLDQSFIKTESDMGLFTSSLVNSNFLLSLIATSNYFKDASDSQFALSDSELSDTSSTVISEKGDVSTTPFSYSSIMDTVKHTSDFVTTSHFNEQSVSVIQISFLSSVTIRTLIQTSSVRNNETAENTYTERHSSLPTTLFSSMTDTITETVSSTYDDKVILLTSSEQMLLVTSSLNTLGSFTLGIEDSERITKSFVKTISKSSNEVATFSSSLDKFSPIYIKTTTTIQHGLSESSKDDIFISAISGTIGAVISVVLIAMVISRYCIKRNKFEDKKDDKISNQFGWSNEGGMNSYNKNYTSREYIFNSSSIHLPLKSYESPYFPYPNNYNKNWDDST